MTKSKLDQLRIEREPEVESKPNRWPLLIFIAAGLVAVAYWFFLKPPAAIEVSTAVAREISNQTASTVLNASGYVTARRPATIPANCPVVSNSVPVSPGQS